MTGDRSAPWRAGSVSPRDALDNAYDDVHEHPTEWADAVSLEPRVPHPGGGPIEAATEPREAHPERGHRIARPIATRHRDPHPGITRTSR
jgi:hypothetical protein